MGRVTREVWHCDVCSWEWIPDNAEIIPTQCPNRKCRSRKWNQGGLGGGKVQRGEADVRYGEHREVGKRCPGCEGKLIAWGAEYRCESCKRNWPK